MSAGAGIYTWGACRWCEDDGMLVAGLCLTCDRLGARHCFRLPDLSKSEAAAADTAWRGRQQVYATFSQRKVGA